MTDAGAAVGVIISIIALVVLTQPVVAAEAETTPPVSAPNNSTLNADGRPAGNITSAKETDFEPGAETRLEIDGEAAGMIIWVHYGMLLNLPEGGAFGVTIKGTLENKTVTDLRTAVTFRGESNWLSLPTNLWDRFGTTGHMHLDLPFMNATQIDGGDIEPKINNTDRLSD